MQRREFHEVEKKEFEDRVVEINRISRTVKGGRRIRFRALIVSGNQKGKIGIGIAKAAEVAGAIQKATQKAHKSMVEIPLTESSSIPERMMTSYGSASILLKPAPVGTSIIAGGTVRIIADLAGIKNLVAKSFGSNNKINIAMATFNALKEIKAK